MAVLRNRASINPSNCSLCGKPVDKNHPDTWKEVIGWVGGPRKDSMRLREDTGFFAHDECVAKVQSGQAVEQESILDGLSAGSVEAYVTRDQPELQGTDAATLEGLLHD